MGDFRFKRPGATWRYRLQLGGPTLSETINRPWESVIHLQYGADAAQPWQGISRFGVCARNGGGWRRRWKNGYLQEADTAVGYTAAHFRPLATLAGRR